MSHHEHFQYSDLSHHVDSLTGTDYFKDPTRVDPHKDWTFTLSAKPKKEVSTSFTLTEQHEFKGDQKVEARKTESKISYTRVEGEHFNWTFSNDKFVAKVEKDELLNGDVHVDASLTAEFKPSKDEYKITGHVDGHTPDFNGVRGFFHTLVEYNQKKEVLIKQGLNFAHEEQHHAGLYFEHDTHEFKKLWAQLAFTPKGDFSGFARGDIKEHFVSLGLLHKFSKDIKHAYEVSYNAKDGAKGFQGFPVDFKHGGSYKLSDSTHLKSHIEAGEHYGYELNVEHKLDNHWTVAAHQDFCSSKLKEKFGPYEIGFKVNYKL